MSKPRREPGRELNAASGAASRHKGTKIWPRVKQRTLDASLTQRRAPEGSKSTDPWRCVKLAPSLSGAISLLCAFVSSWLTLLAGCAEAPPPRLITQIQVEKPEIPGELLACPAIPLPPEGIAMQSDVAAYIIDLFDAGSECRRKLDAVGGLVGEAREQQVR